MFTNSNIQVSHTFTFIIGLIAGSTLDFLSLKLENRLKKHDRNVTEIKYGFVKLALIFLLLQNFKS